MTPQIFGPVDPDADHGIIRTAVNLNFQFLAAKGMVKMPNLPNVLSPVRQSAFYFYWRQHGCSLANRFRRAADGPDTKNYWKCLTRSLLNFIENDIFNK